MADQATLKAGASSNGTAPRPPGADSDDSPQEKQGVVGKIANFGNDAFSLVELQAKLAAADAKEAAGLALVPLMGAGVGLALALASLPVMLLGLADVISQSFAITPGSARLLTGAAALAIAVFAFLIGFRRSLSALSVLRRSQDELVRNLAWIRTVLVYSGRERTRS